jgi:hypothetical protein|tara:strand:+ start:63 stop:293 length:231 start_codon:yes stop_codon:yes gene_type:complete
MNSNIYPLGKLSVNQIKKGQIVLKKLEEVIKTTNDQKKLLSLSNEFYSTIPHVNIKLISSMEDIDTEEKLLDYMLL